MSKRLITVVSVIVACLASMMALGSSPVSAQDDEATYPLTIEVLQCDTVEACDAGEGVSLGDATVYVTSEDGSIDYGSCVTVADEGCTIEVDPETTIVSSVDAATIPDGYVSLEDPVVFAVPASSEDAIDFSIYLTAQEDTVPNVEDTDEEAAAVEDATPAAELPSTGTGSDSGAPMITTPIVLLGGFAVFAVLILGGFVVTRGTGNQER